MLNGDLKHVAELSRKKIKYLDRIIKYRITFDHRYQKMVSFVFNLLITNLKHDFMVDSIKFQVNSEIHD